jgi:lipopolysaccharide export system protein LptA
MNVSVERLRVWLLVGAGLLVVVVAGFLGYAHFRAHRFLTNLPGKLGVDIRRESNGITWSQSVEGRTVYTIHAAKAVERSDGKMTLHDVGIVLYGRKEDRADRIYGNEFEYDQKNGVVRAVGEVHIDLQAPEAADANTKMDYAAGKDLKGSQAGSEFGASVAGGHETKDEHLIHVTTSGLVFLQKLGVAATDKDIEFESGGLTGHAVGADYSSDTGVVVLHSAVKVNGLQHDRPVVLTGSHAVLDRPGQTMVLSQAKYVEVGGQTDGAQGQTAQAQHVVVHLRKDGSAERVEADGEVTLANGRGGSVVAPRGEMILNALNQPQSAMMMGGVRYGSDDPLRQAKGEAAEGHAAFDKKGHPEHVTMSGPVSLQERVRGSAAEPWSERELSAGAVELALATDPAGKALLRDAKATGSARLKQSNVSAKGGTTSSEVAGDVLTAHFVRVEGADHLAEVHGDGNTSLRKVAPNGVVNTSSADSMVAHFRPATTGARHALGNRSRANTTSGGGTGDDIADATDQGHVVLTKLPVKKPGDTTAPVEERVTAERAVYVHEAGAGDLERTTLMGNVQVSDGTNVLWADQVTEQQTGDATAEGSVKASYGQAGSADGPVHVLAARAELKHDSEIAIFHGVPGKPARLWQGTSQVDAPVLEFDRKQKRLLAHGEGQGAPMAVHAVMVKTPSVRSSAKQNAVKSDGIAKKVAKGGTGTDVIQVASRELTYSDETRKAEFSGGVDVENGDGNMKAEQIEIYLQPAPVGAGKANGGGKTGATKTGIVSPADGSGFIGGKVERMVASGRIEMEQPGRRATGEQLVYTAGDDTYVLTGTAMASPKVVDDQRGTVTGTSLRFHPGDDSVIVSNGGETGTGQRVRTETRVKNKQ